MTTYYLDHIYSFAKSLLSAKYGKDISQADKENLDRFWISLKSFCEAFPPSIKSVPYDKEDIKNILLSILSTDKNFNYEVRNSIIKRFALE